MLSASSSLAMTPLCDRFDRPEPLVIYNDSDGEDLLYGRITYRPKQRMIIPERGAIDGDYEPVRVMARCRKIAVLLPYVRRI